MFNFEELMLSGYILCYGPLALVILGFIAFAFLTDGQARRTYLRRLDPRPEAQRVDEGPVARTEAITALTPSGVSVRLLPDEAPVVAPPVRAAAVGVPLVAETVADDLKLIEGIGPKISSVLMGAGITTFAQLAATSPDALRRILNDAGLSAINDPATWPDQAALAADGNWDGLALLQNELRGGRR